MVFLLFPGDPHRAQPDRAGAEHDRRAARRDADRVDAQFRQTV